MANLAGHCWQKLAYSIPQFLPISLSPLIYCGTHDLEKSQRKKIENYDIRAAFGDVNPESSAHRSNDLLDDESKHGPALVHLDLDVLNSNTGKTNEYAATR